MDDEKKLEFSNGSIMVMKYGKQHSMYGPAIVSPWSIHFYINGMLRTPEEWAYETNTTKEELTNIIEKYTQYQKEIKILNAISKR